MAGCAELGARCLLMPFKPGKFADGRTILDLLPCVDAPSEEHSDVAMERMAEERERLSEHIDELIRTRETLDALMAAGRAFRETLDPKVAC